VITKSDNDVEHAAKRLLAARRAAPRRHRLRTICQNIGEADSVGGQRVAGPAAAPRTRTQGDRIAARRTRGLMRSQRAQVCGWRQGQRRTRVASRVPITNEVSSASTDDPARSRSAALASLSCSPPVSSARAEVNCGACHQVGRASTQGGQSRYAYHRVLNAREVEDHMNIALVQPCMFDQVDGICAHMWSQSRRGLKNRQLHALLLWSKRLPPWQRAATRT
jgi:hypothetical protein